MGQAPHLAQRIENQGAGRFKIGQCVAFLVADEHTVTADVEEVARQVQPSANKRSYSASAGP